MSKELDAFKKYRDSLSPELQKVFDDAKQEVIDAYKQGPSPNNSGGGGGGSNPEGYTNPKIPGPNDSGDGGSQNNKIDADLSEFFDKPQNQNNEEQGDSAEKNSSDQGSSGQDSSGQGSEESNGESGNQNLDGTKGDEKLFDDPSYWDGYNDGVKSVIEGSQSGSQSGMDSDSQSNSQSGMDSGSQPDSQSGMGSDTESDMDSGSQSGSQSDSQSAYEKGRQAGIKDAQKVKQQMRENNLNGQNSNSQQGSQSGMDSGSQSASQSSSHSNSQQGSQSGMDSGSQSASQPSNNSGKTPLQTDGEIISKNEMDKIRQENGYEKNADVKNTNVQENLKDMEKTLRDAVAEWGKMDRDPGRGSFLGSWSKIFKERDELKAQTEPDKWRELFADVIADTVIYKEKHNYSKKRLALPNIYKETRFYKTRYTKDPGDKAYSAVFFIDLSGSMSQTQVHQCLSEVLVLLEDSPVVFDWIQVIYFSDGIEQYDRIRSIELDNGEVDPNDMETIWPTDKDVAGGTNVTKSINQLINTQWTEYEGDDTWAGVDDSPINENTIIIMMTDGDAFIEGDNIIEELQENKFIFMSINTRQVNKRNKEMQDKVTGDLDLDFIPVDVEKLIY